MHSLEVQYRFLTKIKVNLFTQCWEWLGSKNLEGYGKATVCSKGISSHRLSYEIFRGRISEGLHLDHLCRNRGCCNPWHLEEVTPAENLRRGLHPTKAHCKHGHSFADHGYLTKRGHRRCRICTNQWARESGARHAQKKRDYNNRRYRERTKA